LTSGIYKATASTPSLLLMYGQMVTMVSVDESSRNNAVVLVSPPAIVTASLILASLNDVLVRSSGIHFATALTPFLFGTYGWMKFRICRTHKFNWQIFYLTLEAPFRDIDTECMQGT